MKIPIVELKLHTKSKISIPTEYMRIHGIETAAPVFCKTIGDNNVECVAVLCLDNTYKVVNYSTVSIGGIGAVHVSVSQILKIALLSNSSKIIVAHNHPSGVIEVTEDDIKMTKKIGAAVKLCDIQLIDSIIVNATNAVSIREKLVN